MKRAWLHQISAMLVAALIPCSAVAEIYKCVQDGRTVYQDQPCRGAGSAIVVVSPETSAASPPVTGSEERLTRLKAYVNEMARERRKREIAFEIGGLEREISGYERAEKIELAALTDKKGYNYHNLDAAGWQREWVLKSIDMEMRSVTEKYTAMKQAARDRVSRLQKEVADIDKPR
ncbi:MAG: DUF4124 domain-containing protein [Betaproteobacteria bacterium]|nr:MAG: DUF4124 domain-containing protein [Betaproteobacteria bacterium]